MHSPRVGVSGWSILRRVTFMRRRPSARARNSTRRWTPLPRPTYPAQSGRRISLVHRHSGPPPSKGLTRMSKAFERRSMIQVRRTDLTRIGKSEELLVQSYETSWVYRRPGASVYWIGGWGQDD